MFKKLRKNDKKGFTLIEILVVIALIGVLAAIAVPRFSNVQAGVKEKADIAALKLWANEVEQLYILDKIAKTTDLDATEAEMIALATLPKLQGLVGTTAAVDAVTASIDNGKLVITYDPDAAGAVHASVDVVDKTLEKIK